MFSAAIATRFFRRIAVSGAVAICSVVHAGQGEGQGAPYEVGAPGSVGPSPVAPQFVTPAEVDAFQAMVASAIASPLPSARSVAKSLVDDEWGIDSDRYVVAHFATPADRARGTPDSALLLTDALMEAFPEHSRHSFFARLSDAVGGINAGGSASPGVVPTVGRLIHAADAKHVFALLGGFLWSRTGPGYVYNTFFARGNVIDTVAEDARSLDEAFGVYAVGGYSAAYASGIRLSQLVERFAAPATFAELPYVTKLVAALDAYWQTNRRHWPLIARYEFIHRARLALDAGVLDQARYELAMQGGAPLAPLTGPLVLSQLEPSPPTGGVEARRFDINGYAASDMVRFVAPDGSEVLYVAGGDPAFVAVENERELRAWTLAQARDPKKLDALLSHFSVYDTQDGVFWTGVKAGLEKIASGQWQADERAVDRSEAIIAGDVFEDMRQQVEGRLRNDARMQASTAWEAWRGTIHRTITLLGPLGYVPALAVPLQATTGLVEAGLGVEQAADGRTSGERNAGVEDALSALVENVPLGLAFGGHLAGGHPFFKAPERVNGRIGYPLSPTMPPAWPVDLANRIYRGRNGRLSLWVGADAERHAVRLPTDAALRSDGVFVYRNARFVQVVIRGRGLRTVRVAPDADGYHLVLQDGSPGPRVERQENGNWLLAFGEDGCLAGSVLSEIVKRETTADPATLHRAGEVLAQLGVSESMLAQEYLVHNDVEAKPLLAVALGHGFIETLPARLRDPANTLWSAREVAMIAPMLAKQAGRPLALYHSDGRFHLGMAPDGTDFPAGRVPSGALHLRRHGEGYAVSPLQSDAHAEFPSVFAAMAESLSASADGTPATPALREAAFRRALADALDARSARGELQRMHRMWLEPVARTQREKQLIRRISRLRHALVDKHEPLAPDQRRWLLSVAQDVRGETASIDLNDSAEGIALLPAAIEAESGLLPAGFDRLLVNDPLIAAQARRGETEQWSDGAREYVRLRHLDGRMQVVETGPEHADRYREVLAPGDGADRRTGRYVVEVGGMWLPEEAWREGFTPLDPGEHTEALAAAAAHWPGEVDDDFANVERVVDAIPQPLLRFVRTSLAGIDVAEDGGLEVKVEHPVSKQRMAFATHRDAKGRPVTATPSGAVPSVAPAQAVSMPVDDRLVLPLPVGARVVAIGPPPDPAPFATMVRAGRPLSAFIEAGAGDRHIRTLANTRRLRGMVREDAHIALVGAMPEHVLTMVMPLSAESIDMAVRGSGRMVHELPAGTAIVDEMYGVRSPAAEYPGRIRDVARRWDAAGVRIRGVDGNGLDTWESPIPFTERLLATAVRPSLWNPRNDPISEAAYVEYMQRRHASGQPVRYAGLDWLQTRAARRDYTVYFSPPYDVVPDGVAPPSTDLPAATVHALAETAIEMTFRTEVVTAEVATPQPEGLWPDAGKEPRTSVEDF